MHGAPVRAIGVSALVLSALLIFATGAQAGARKYTITGPSRSLTYQVPGGLGTLPLINPPGANPYPGAAAEQTGSGPATLTLPPGIWDQAGPVPFIFPVGPPAPPQYIQFASFNYIQAAPTATAMFRESHWTATRANLNFSFCPGAGANPTCTTDVTTGGTTQGTKEGRVRYTAGGNRFGGTMGSVLGGIAVISLNIGGGQNLHLQLTNHMINGQPYAAFSSGVGPPGIITTGGVQSAGGLITQPGNQVGTQAGFSRSSFGFPFTTGMVIVSIPPGSNPTTDPPTTFSATGADFRTALGAGNIQMVAGALGNASADGAFPTMEIINFSLIPLTPVPSMGRVGLAAMATLMAVAGFFASRRWRR
jgi:hypothetical protein